MTTPYDLVCLSHLRWNFVWQRPQHLMQRCARERRVFFVEEPLLDGAPHLELVRQPGNVTVVVPHLPADISLALADVHLMMLLDDLLIDERVMRYVLWYYTPMARSFTRHLSPAAIVYDCMDELSAFASAPTELVQHEHELLLNADLVFTGGVSLYHAKRHMHPSVYAMPSSVDAAHFAAARTPQPERPEQATLPHPRIGYYAVLDERLDCDLVAALADLRPHWSFVLVGPVVKIDPAILPRRPNLHYLGQHAYADLPAFLAGWDVAMMPFAHNAATRYISPTKTLEYLAAGKPVVSTSIADVVHPYGDQALVRIADAPADFITAIEAALGEDATARLARTDAFVHEHSWDRTWQRMQRLIDEALATLDRLPRLDPVSAARTPEIPLSVIAQENPNLEAEHLA